MSRLLSSPTHITISNLNVPAGQTLELKLSSDTTVVFNGTVNFGFKAWNGPLIKITGSNVNIIGTASSSLDGNGKQWWDGQGTKGGKQKPVLLELALQDSTVSGLRIKNTPATGISIKNSESLNLNGVIVDNKAAPNGAAKNTDGITVAKSESVSLKSVMVSTQGNCVVAASGTGTILNQVVCNGGEGILLGPVGENGNKYLEEVRITNTVVRKADYGVRVKLANGAVGQLNEVTLQNISLQDIKKGGIVMYEGVSSNVAPTGSVPVTNVVVKNVKGNVLKGGMNLNVLAKSGNEWSWDSNITGGTVKTNCNGLKKGSVAFCM